MIDFTYICNMIYYVLSSFLCLFVVCWLFSKHFLQEYHQGSKHIGFPSDPTYCQALSWSKVFKGYEQTTVVGEGLINN